MTKIENLILDLPFLEMFLAVMACFVVAGYCFIALEEMMFWLLMPSDVEEKSETAGSMLGFRGDKRLFNCYTYKPKMWYRIARAFLSPIWPLTHWFHKKFVIKALLVFYDFVDMKTRQEE